jgi:hypothetical protein
MSTYWYVSPLIFPVLCSTGLGLPNNNILALTVVPVSFTMIGIVSPATVVVNEVPFIDSVPAVKIYIAL